MNLKMVIYSYICLLRVFLYWKNLFEIELSLVRQDIGLLKVENKNQSDQITLLKGMVESHNKVIKEKIVEELNKKMKDCAMTDNESLSPEQKQIFRLIPTVHADPRTNNCRLLSTV